ncbi:MAG: tRNA (adenosine(37)-N6)-threonylcarbamoyltransferase complex ATPase subunit type 1 TsaE [Caldimicrobium sp.]|nr:tRNA (adenosine(37)-N6)-threonylcarbamoyltransferase complex ATPase subunit type 1 TsaE [Caldimicrobium sp.]MCX7872974.1 tRNA (adenosine(37)-N6)-threonylcarbamoyltransferase complex ATPase subunit type 1 TsaE [Caldimicrobium sp.]
MLKSPEETKKIGRIIAKYLKPGDLVLLYGDLGAGKTTLIQGIVEGLEVDPQVYVTSPTFAIVNLYEGKYTIIHLDLYRLETEDIEDLGIWEYLSSSIVLIEWADRLSKIPGEDFLEIHLKYLNGQGRIISLVGYGLWSELLKALGKDEELTQWV